MSASFLSRSMQWVALLFFFSLVVIAPAQDATTVASDAAAPVRETLGGLLTHSGPVVWICLILAAVVIALVIDGFLKFRYNALVPPDHLLRLQEFIISGAYQQAWDFCEANPSFLGAMVQAGLEQVGRGRDAVEFALEDASIEQAILLRTPLHYLSAIGVVAPMLGLAGTVLGMIRALETLSQSGTGDYASLAGAIGQVLVSTEAGLAVAIPGFAFYYFFKARAQTSVLRADRTVFRLFDHLSYDLLAGLQPGTTHHAATEESLFPEQDPNA